MGTRCVIAKEQPDGGFRAIICAMDGNPEQAGMKLLQFYQDQDRIDRLLELGNISSLGASPDEPVDYRGLIGKEVEEMFQTINDRCLVFPDGLWVEEKLDSRGHEEFRGRMEHSGAQYAYIYGECGWTLSEPPGADPVSLEQALKDREITNRPQRV